MTRKPFLQGLLFAFAVLMCAVAPARAQGVGAIGGTVMDSSGAVLPGATITLTSAQGTVGSNQEVVSDSRGAYQFQRLVPGTYSVKATMSGFRQVEQRNIVVNADAQARADLSLPLGQLEEGVVVSGEAPLLDTTSALRQTVLSAETLEQLPNRLDVWSITRVIPSVVVTKVDVGGSESFQQSGITVHGTNTEGGYYVDGMDVSHMAHLSRCGTVAGELLGRMLRYPLEQSAGSEHGHFLIHDALAVGVLLWPELFMQTKMALQMVTQGEQAGRCRPVVVKDKHHQLGVVISGSLLRPVPRAIAFG
jgi:hypothetical protein